MSTPWLLAAWAILYSGQAPGRVMTPSWQPIRPAVRETLIRQLGFDPGFDEEKEEPDRGRPALWVGRGGSSSHGVIDIGSGRLCRLFNFTNEPPLLDSSMALTREQATDRAMAFISGLGIDLNRTWTLRSCDLVNHGDAGHDWHLVFHKYWKGVRLPASLRLVMHAGTGAVVTFKIIDDPVQPNLVLDLSADEAVARVAARAGFSRYEIVRLELSIGYDTADWTGRQYLYWGMRLRNPDARGLSDSEVTWGRINAETGRIADLGMPLAASSANLAVQTDERRTARQSRKELSATRGWTTAAIRKTKWPKTVFDTRR